MADKMGSWPFRRKEGRKEGRKAGRQEGRKAGRKESNQLANKQAKMRESNKRTYEVQEERKTE